MIRRLFALVLLGASPLAAQTAASTAVAGPVMNSTVPHYERIKDYVARAAEQMPEEHYAFQPTSEVRTFGQIVGHIADTHYFFCGRALGEASPMEESMEETRTTKAGLVEALRASFVFCDRAYAMSDAQATRAVEVSGREQVPLSWLVLNVGHDNEHYGNLVTYMRINGLVPPSSQPRS